MPTLLRIDSSPMGERSISRKLTEKFADSWRKSHPGGKVIIRDLCALELPVVNGSWVGAAYAPSESRTPEQTKALTLSDSLVADLQEADEYVLGVPMHNFSVPASLKLWIDQISRVGKTFTYSDAGAKGLLTGKRATLLLASGGVYESGSPMASFDFVAPYLRAMFGFLGVTDVTIIAAEGTAQLNTGTVDPETFLAPSLEKVHAHAAHKA
jgi:FMN-dependent NADH-azoreductase